MTVVFDKLAFMRHLESDGTFARPQAEKLSEAIHGAFQEGVATKADIERLETRIDGLEARMDARFGAMETKFDGRSSAMEAKFDARFGAMETKSDGKFATFDAKLDASLASMKVWFGGGLVALFTALSAIRFFGH